MYKPEEWSLVWVNHKIHWWWLGIHEMMLHVAKECEDQHEGPVKRYITIIITIASPRKVEWHLQMDTLHLFLKYAVNPDLTVCFVIKVKEKAKRPETITQITLSTWWSHPDMEMNITMIYSKCLKRRRSLWKKKHRCHQFKQYPAARSRFCDITPSKRFVQMASFQKSLLLRQISSG